MVTIRITGPESCGKSTLAEELKSKLGGVLVPEAARIYLNSKDHYDQSDLLAIAKIQRTTELHARDLAPNFLIADTDMLVLSIWHREKYGEDNSWIQEQLDNSHYNITLLCSPDLSWVPDPQREHPTDRARLFTFYRDELEARKQSYFIVSGEGKKRAARVLDYLKQKGHITK